MPAGRPRKPISMLQGHKTKEEKRLREDSESTYSDVGRLMLVPSDVLSDRAKQKFEQIVSDAFWLDELSVDLLNDYCFCWDRWLDVAEKLKSEPETFAFQDEVTGELKMRANPNRRALMEYGLAMQQLSAKLGLGNIDRLKLVAPAKEEKSKFAEFIKIV